jgi:hypothetical protein
MLIAEKTDASFEYNEDSGGEVEEDDVLPEEGSKKKDKTFLYPFITSLARG